MAIFRVTLTGTHYGSITCQNVLHFDKPDFVGTFDQVAAEMRDGWCTLLAAGQTTQWGWRSVTVKQVGSNAAPFTLPIVVNGLDASDASAAVPIVCQKFRLLTGVGGKRGRGRIYLPGYRQAYWNQGQITATGITNMTIRLNAITARYVNPATSGYLLCVGPRGENPAVYLHVVSISLSQTPGVQRRRNLGVGV